MKPEGISFSLDPPLEDALVDRLAEIWLEVTNAGGAVGAAAPATHDDLRPVREDALGRVAEGKDHIVVAFIDGDVAGFGFLSFRPGPLFRHWATVKRLQVDPALQGRGVGGALLAEMTRVARDIGLEQLHLTVRGGTGREAFYQRYGYRVAARIPDVIRVAPDDTREEIYMVARI